MGYSWGVPLMDLLVEPLQQTQPARAARTADTAWMFTSGVMERNSLWLTAPLLQNLANSLHLLETP